MYEPHPAFEPPSDNARLWRYIDPAKFVSMLQTSSIYFPRADRLGDPYEGALPKKTFQKRRALIESLTEHTGHEWEWTPGIDPDAPPQVLTVKSTFVSCWNISEYENAAGRLAPRFRGRTTRMVGRHSPVCENDCLVNEAAAFVCPACGHPVEPGEDYVVAREHPGEPEVALHLNGEQSGSVERRFHVGHFRGRLGDCFYELIGSAVSGD